eukprot:scaffold990_cov393-Prasinococcus_capsulatus_cf.AAC.18
MLHSGGAQSLLGRALEASRRATGLSCNCRPVSEVHIPRGSSGEGPMAIYSGVILGWIMAKDPTVLSSPYKWLGVIPDHFGSLRHGEEDPALRGQQLA